VVTPERDGQVEVVQEGSSFEDWYTATYDRLARTMTVMLANVEVGRQVADEAMTKAFGRWGDKVPPSADTWVFAVALKTGRRRERRRQIDQFATTAATHRVVESLTERDLDLWREAAALPLRSREAAALRYIGELTDADVAIITGNETEAPSAELEPDRFGPLREIDIGPPPPIDRIAVRMRDRARRRQLGVAGISVVGLALVLSTTNLRSPTTLEPETADQPRTSLPDTDRPGGATCAGEMPVFATLSPDGRELARTDFHGASGPAPDSVPALDGQRVSHWLGDFDVAIEIRWPGSPIPRGSSTTQVVNEYGIGPVLAHDAVNSRFIASVDVDGASADGCDLVSIEIFGPRVDPIFDSAWGFAAGLRPVADLSDTLADEDGRAAQATPDDTRPLGECASSIVITGEEPSDRALITLAERFLADRLAGAAAELCLTEPGLNTYLTRYLTHQPMPENLPPLCLYECPEGSAIGGRVQVSPGRAGAEILIDYEIDGEVRTLREELSIEVLESGLLLISSASLDVDSHISESLGRTIISELLDALAAGEWDVAAAALLNEGSGVDDERVGEDWYVRGYDEVFSQLCETAVCGAPYTIGESTRASETSRTMAVTFQTADGPVVTEMQLGMFEGITTAMTLPPDGTVLDAMPSIDVRLFGEPYSGELTVLRHRSAEHIVDGESTWSSNWRYRNVGDQFAIAGGIVVRPHHTGARGTFYLEATGLDFEEDIFTDEHEGGLRGASTADGHALAFVRDGGYELIAIDLESGEQARLPCEVCVEHSDERVWFVDAGDTRIALGHGAGDSYSTTIYEFDPATLTLGEQVGVVGFEQSHDRAQLSPDGGLVAALLFPGLNEPSRSVALFDTVSGERTSTHTYTLEGEATIESMDYDGRFILAELSNGTTWVIDTTESGAERIVTVPARIRFG